MNTNDFYDPLAPYYHLVHGNWGAAVQRQGRELARLLSERGVAPGARVRDVACGIGTQSLGLALAGYQVTASDLSPEAVRRTRAEASARGLELVAQVADMRVVDGQGWDAVIACDNALPHLLTDADLLQALQGFHAALRPGGVCLLSVRDYGAMELGGTRLVPFGVREEDGARWLVHQVWTFRDRLYELDLYLTEDRGGPDCVTRVFRSVYYAVTIPELLGLMERAGFTDVERLDDVFFQPVLVGVRA